MSKVTDYRIQLEGLDARISVVDLGAVIDLWMQSRLRQSQYGQRLDTIVSLILLGDRYTETAQDKRAKHS
jgi:hypothetical protein